MVDRLNPLCIGCPTEEMAHAVDARHVTGRCERITNGAGSGRSLAWLPAVPCHGASLNGGYRSVTRTNA
jgi:ABC-type xylose transport system permease subunit